jgi:predicted nucleic acid-binding Zn ribbon protein
MADSPLTACPACGKPVRKIISCPSIGASTSSFDAHAKNKGFHKLQRLSKGEYEVKY